MGCSFTRMTGQERWLLFSPADADTVRLLNGCCGCTVVASVCRRGSAAGKPSGLTNDTFINNGKAAAAS
jgi:hypothetical protein